MPGISNKYFSFLILILIQGQNLHFRIFKTKKGFILQDAFLLYIFNKKIRIYETENKCTETGIKVVAIKDFFLI